MTTNAKLPKHEPKPITSAALFLGLCNLRATEGALRWQGAQLGFLLNLPAMAASVLKLATGPSIKELVLISLGNAACCAVNWFLYEVIRRDGKYVDLWNELLSDLERVNGTDGDLCVFSSEKFARLRDSRGRLQHRLQALIIGCIVAWGGLSIFSFGMIFGVK